MKAFKQRSIMLDGDRCQNIRINSAKNFIDDIIALGILIPYDSQ